MLTASEIEKIRKDTPATKNLIHFNNAGASLMPNPVLQEIKAYLDEESQIGGYETAKKRERDIVRFYMNLGNLIGARRKNIAFCANATDAYARALLSIPFQKGDVILTTTNDYISNHLVFMSMANRFGLRILKAENTADGRVDLDSIQDQLEKYHPRLLAVTHVPTNSGLVQPVEEIGEITANFDTLYLVDGCQSAGQINLDVKKIGCDFFSATFRKFLRGPRGAGFLYVSDHVLKAGLYPLHLDMRGAHWTSENEFQLVPHARRFEDWENPYALLMGSSKAARYVMSIGLDRIEARVSELADYLREGLQRISKAQVLDQGTKKCGIVTMHLQDADPDSLVKYLTAHNINGGMTTAANARIDFKEKGVSWALRLSPHYFNTHSEIDRVLDCILEFASLKN
jgi:selenocysteine lyase/cysteine desulfurase